MRWYCTLSLVVERSNQQLADLWRSGGGYSCLSGAAISSNWVNFFTEQLGFPACHTGLINSCFFFQDQVWVDGSLFFFSFFFKALGTAITRRATRIYPVGYAMAPRFSCGVGQSRGCLTQHGSVTNLTSSDHGLNFNNFLLLTWARLSPSELEPPCVTPPPLPLLFL